MSKFFLILFALAFFSVGLPLAGICAAQGQEPPQAVVTAAMAGLPAFLQAIPSDELANFNFASPEDLERATLGAPFQIHAINPQDILEYDGRTSVADLVRPTGAWLVPVLVDGSGRALLTVEKVDGVWTAVAIGASGLAQEWDGLGRAYPHQAGYDMTFVRVFQAVSDFALLDQPGRKTAMIPMRSASVVLGMPQGTTQAPERVIENLREPVRMNLELNGSHQ